MMRRHKWQCRPIGGFVRVWGILVPSWAQGCDKLPHIRVPVAIGRVTSTEIICSENTSLYQLSCKFHASILCHNPPQQIRQTAIFHLVNNWTYHRCHFCMEDRGQTHHSNMSEPLHQRRDANVSYNQWHEPQICFQTSCQTAHKSNYPNHVLQEWLDRVDAHPMTTMRNVVPTYRDIWEMFTKYIRDPRIYLQRQHWQSALGWHGERACWVWNWL